MFDDREDAFLSVKMDSSTRLDDTSPIDVYERWQTEEHTIHMR